MKPPASCFPYGHPEDPAMLCQVDALMQETVVRINRSGWLWTVQCCEGHPWPMLEVVVEARQRERLLWVVGRVAEKQQVVVTLTATCEDYGVQWERWRLEVPAVTMREREAGRVLLDQLCR